jgi:chaperonin GroES
MCGNFSLIILHKSIPPIKGIVISVITTKNDHMKHKKQSKTKVQPLGDRVILRPLSETEKKSKAGFIILETKEKEKPETATVVAVGEGRVNDTGTRIKMNVKVGDTVLFSKYMPDEIKIDGETLLVLREDQIIAIIK